MAVAILSVDPHTQIVLQTIQVFALVQSISTNVCRIKDPQLQLSKIFRQSSDFSHTDVLFMLLLKTLLHQG